jgi:hypothetical protein
MSMAAIRQSQAHHLAFPAQPDKYQPSPVVFLPTYRYNSDQGDEYGHCHWKGQVPY